MEMETTNLVESEYKGGNAYRAASRKRRSSSSKSRDRYVQEARRASSLLWV